MFGMELGKKALFPKFSERSYFIIIVVDYSSAEGRFDWRERKATRQTERRSGS